MIALALLHGLILAVWPVWPVIALGVWWNSNTISHDFDYSLPLLGLRDGPWKFIYRLDTRRFNLDRDPGEQSDLASAYAERVARYEQVVRNWSASQRDYIAVNRRP